MSNFIGKRSKIEIAYILPSDVSVLIIFGKLDSGNY